MLINITKAAIFQVRKPIFPHMAQDAQSLNVSGLFATHAAIEGC